MGKRKPRIRFLESTFGNSEGDTVAIQHETAGEIYYNDGFDRYCYVEKSEEGTTFERVISKSKKAKGERMNKIIHVWDFIPEFVEHWIPQLQNDENRWGNTWLQRMPEGQEVRIEEHIRTYFDQWRNAGVPIPWMKIAGLALIAWIRETHPELFVKDGSDGK